MYKKALLLVLLTALVASCGGGGGGGSPSGHPGTLIGIDVRPELFSEDIRYVGAGETIQFVARGNYSDGDNGVALTGVNWSSEAPLVASVDGTGLVTGVVLGNATVTARIGGISGTNTVGVTAPSTGWSKVSVGKDHVLAVKADGSLWSWYYTTSYSFTSFGQLGNGSAALVYTPVQVGTDTNWASVSAGYYRSFALKKDGTLWSWGENTNGELGDGSTVNRNVPTQIGTSTNWASISTKWDHTLALQKNGTLWGWGYNIWDQLGISAASLGYAYYAITPTQIGIATDWAMVSTGEAHSMAIKTDGSLWAWGTSEHGELGNSITSGYFNRYFTPTRIGTETNWSKVAAGFWNTLAVKTDGSLYGWGYDYASDSSPTAISPTRMGAENNWSDVTQGYSYGIASKSDGSLWSTRTHDVVGNVGPTQRVGAATGWISASVGESFSTLAINSNGIMSTLDSSNPGPIVDIPINGTGAGPSPSVVAPPPPSSSGGTGGLTGTWCASASGDQNCWVFDNNTGSSNGKFYQKSINQYSGTLTNTMTWSANGSTLTYKFTRSTLTNSSYNYDDAVNIGPYAFPYTLTSTTFTFQGVNFFKQ